MVSKREFDLFVQAFCYQSKIARKKLHALFLQALSEPGDIRLHGE